MQALLDDVNLASEIVIKFPVDGIKTSFIEAEVFTIKFDSMTYQILVSPARKGPG